MSMAQEFKQFALRGNVVDMAVGIIVGAAFGKIVSSFVSDVVMPGLNGHELSQMLRLREPRLRTLFVSGYSFDARGDGAESSFDDESFLPKPYDPAELARRVRSILDTEPASAS